MAQLGINWKDGNWKLASWKSPTGWKLIFAIDFTKNWEDIISKWEDITSNWEFTGVNISTYIPIFRPRRR